MYRNVILILLSILSVVTTISTINYKSALREIREEQRYKEAEMLMQLRSLLTLSKDVQIATYPTSCDPESRRILGEECDVGNYMEWAAPLLVHKTQILIRSLHHHKQD